MLWERCMMLWDGCMMLCFCVWLWLTLSDTPAVANQCFLCFQLCETVSMRHDEGNQCCPRLRYITVKTDSRGCGHRLTETQGTCRGQGGGGGVGEGGERDKER